MNPALQPIAEEARLSKLWMKNKDRIDSLFISNGTIQPTDVVPVIATGKDGIRKSFPMMWGYHEHGFKTAFITAQAETAMVKKTYMDSWMEHRCIVPASWYFEWERQVLPNGRSKRGQKYAIRPRNSAIAWLGGIYRIENGFPHFVIVTCPAGESISFIHDRMPIMLPEKAIDDWINPKYNATSLLPHALSDCVYEEWTEKEEAEARKQIVVPW